VLAQFLFRYDLKILLGVYINCILFNMLALDLLWKQTIKTKYCKINKQKKGVVSTWYLLMVFLTVMPFQVA